MASYNRYDNNQYDNNIPFNSTVVNRGFFSRILKALSNIGGMSYEDMIIRNTYSIGMNEDPRTDVQSTNMYDIFTKKTISRILDRKSIAYLDRSYADKRLYLRHYAIKDEIKDILTQICDEAIIYDDNNYFCKIKDLPDEFDELVKQRWHENFHKIYRAFGFDDGITAWNYFRNFLIDGYLAFEIIYDNKQKNIIGLQAIDPITLVVASDPETNTIVWIQYPDDNSSRRVLLDSQIIYISYSNNNRFSEVSYVENLIKPYNHLKLLEKTRLLFNLNQASLYKKFVVPINGLSRIEAEEQIRELMSEYYEDVQWDDVLGTVSINGSANIPHSKDFWFPSSEHGTPEVEIIAPQGTDLNEDSMLIWFYKNLKRASKLPFSRFDDDAGGGNIYNDTAEITRHEIRFQNFIKRLRTIFKEIIIKPLKIQMILDFPELKDDNLFHSSIQLMFNSNELFEEWKYLNNLQKRSEIASTLTSNLVDADGKPFLHIEWIARNIMKFSDNDLLENEKYKMKSKGTATPPAQGGQEAVMGAGAEGMIEKGVGEMSAAQGGGETEGGAQAEGGETEGGAEFSF